MSRKERIQQRIIELEQDWAQFTTRIDGLRRDLANATDGEQRATLRERLNDRTAERDYIQAELDKLEQELHSLVAAQNIQRIFISYKRDVDPDESVAMYLARFLSDHGKHTFVDQKLKVGMPWIQEIHDQIAESDFLVVLLSTDSMISDMVLEEVKFADLQWRETGRPRILPIRLNYDGPLPYDLDKYLRPLQYAEWVGEETTPEVARRILNAIEGNETLSRDATSKTNITTPQTASRSTVHGQQLAKPYSNFDPRLILEATGGMVDLDSPFYVERRVDSTLKRELKRQGTTTTIRAGRQMGKTSLLVRGVDFARQQGSSIVFSDFQHIERTYLQSLDIFLHHLALEIAATLKVDFDKVELVWKTPFSSKERLTHFLEDHVLPNVTLPIILAIDEADQLFRSTFYQEFFSLIRAWYTMRGLNSLWRRLNVVMVISTHPNLLIDDDHQSPFNVGLRLELQDFTADQVYDLNERHGTPLNDTELDDMIELLGGHPYLVRQAFFTLVDEEITWTELSKIAPTDSGPFSAHLRQYLWQLRDKPQLTQAMKSILQGQTPSDETALIRLTAAGLVSENEDGQCRCRCRLYHLYFKRFFL